MKISKLSFLKGCVALSLITLSAMTQAQNYPTKPVHFVVAFTAGSGTDIIARAVGDVMGINIY